MSGSLFFETQCISRQTDIDSYISGVQWQQGSGKLVVCGVVYALLQPVRSKLTITSQLCLLSGESK